MSDGTAKASVFQRLDQLNEFERQPVGEDHLEGGGYFAGSFAGEHVAATEFVIGALFVSWGAGLQDVLVGLLLGNLLAVLSWTLICAPIAVQTRLTLYWYLRQIGGPVVMVFYNVLNAILYCVLAGCMITVAASAVRIPFGIEPQTGWLPTDPFFYPVVIAVGAVVMLLAILGFKRLAQFATVCSPWMLLMFVAGALVTLPQLAHVGSMRGFLKVADRQIWTGPAPAVASVEIQDNQAIVRFDNLREGLTTIEDQPVQGFGLLVTQDKDRAWTPAEAVLKDETVIVSIPAGVKPAAVGYAQDGAMGNLTDGLARRAPAFRSDALSAGDPIGFWHVVAFAWICNLAMHLGLSDMALFRYARRASYGLYSSFGMFLGHYVAWICAGIMGAVVAKLLNAPLTSLDSGEVAWQALGWMGALAVVIAGWTTSNPTLYRAGLALQVVTPGWPRWLVTLIAGVVTTAIACSPFVFRHLLNFVGLYGLLLMPVGAIVVVEHWVFPRIGFQRFWSARKRQLVNWPALLAWLISLGAAIYCWQTGLVHLFFLALPVWFLTAGLYILMAAMAGARQPLPELEEPATAPRPPQSPKAAVEVSRASRRLYYFAGGLAFACLAILLLFSVCVFLGLMHLADFQWHLNFITLAYFVSGVVWIRQRDRLLAATQATVPVAEA